MDLSYQVIEPKTPEELKIYYEARHRILIAPLGLAVEAGQDTIEEISVHRMVVDDKGNVVGISRLHYNSDKEGQVRYVGVEESMRGKGLAQRMMKELETVAKEKGVEEIVLNSRDYAVPFYLKLGYKSIKETAMQVGIPHFEMRKMLIEKGEAEKGL